MRGLDAEQHSDHVALGDHVDDLVLAVREGAAQIGARAREALALGIGGEMREAAAPALVVGGEHLALDQRFVLGALQVLETAHHRLVALELITLRSRLARSCQGQSGAERAIDEFATGQHERPPWSSGPSARRTRPYHNNNTAADQLR